MQALTLRPYQSEDDYWRIRAFLRATYLANGCRDSTWHVARLDYWRWHVVLNCGQLPNIEDYIFIWETPQGEIAAVLNPEGAGEAFLQIHPAWKTAELEAEMLDIAEQHLAAAGEDGQRTLYVWRPGEDDQRRRLLEARGYARARLRPEEQRQRVLDGPVAVVPPPEGYTVRALGDASEIPARSWVSWRAFHPDEPDENYRGSAWYPNVQRCPLYRRDLDIVAAAPDGSLAAFCTIWYDDVTRTGCFEPVGVDPDHHRRGLGKAIMTEAMHRVQRMGATRVLVGGFSDAANALYSAVVNPHADTIERWVKTW